MAIDPMSAAALLKTPLHELHLELGAQDGALRRLRDAGPVPGRHPGGAPPLPRVGGAVRRLAHGPAAARRRRRGRGAGDAGAGRLVGLAPGSSATRCSPTRRRHPRRPDGHAPRRPSVPGRQRRLQGRRPRPPRAPHRPALHDRAACPSGRCWRCRGPQAATVLARLAPDTGAADVHDRRRRDVAGMPASSRARATPARTASRSRSPADEAERAGARAAGGARGRARRPRRARLAAARGRAAPLRPRHRRRRPAGRGRPRLGDQKVRRPAARAPAASPARR